MLFISKKNIIRITMLMVFGIIIGMMGVSTHALAEENVKIGILHSLTGTMAISETSLRDVVLMATQEINA